MTKHVPLWLLARDTDGKVQGGLLGQTYWSWCSVDVLAVAEPYRRQGIGSRLLEKAEAIARKRGCIGIRLDTIASRRPASTAATATPNSAASTTIRRATRITGS